MDKKQKPEEGDQRRSAGRMTAPVSAAAAPAIVFSEATTREMDAFVSRCAQWQERLTDLSGFLSKQVARVEQEQVASVLRETVARVEMEHRESHVRDVEMELCWGEIDQQDAVAFAETLTRARGGAQEFEAMERQLVEDRVLELETQLQQKRATEKEKEMELATLRADHDELLKSSAGVSKSEWEKLVGERDALLAKMHDIKAKYKHKSEHMSRLKDEVLNFKFQNADLTEECRALREKNEKMARDAERHQEEMNALKEQLEAAQRRRASEDEELKEEKRWEEEAEGRGKRIDELSAELQRVRSTLAATTDDVATKTSEITRLQEAKAELERELVLVAAECEELVKERQLANGMRADGGLSDDAEHTGARRSSNDGFGCLNTPDRARSPSSATSPSSSKKRRREDPSPTAVDRLTTANETSGITEASLKRQAAEKELLQEFFKRYYRAAEKKCGDLMRQVSKLQEQSAVQSQQARESLDALRLCAQADTWDDAVRTTLLNVVSVLGRSVS